VGNVWGNTRDVRGTCRIVSDVRGYEGDAKGTRGRKLRDILKHLKMKISAWISGHFHFVKTEKLSFNCNFAVQPMP